VDDAVIEFTHRFDRFVTWLSSSELEYPVKSLLLLKAGSALSLVASLEAAASDVIDTIASKTALLAVSRESGHGC